MPASVWYIKACQPLHMHRRAMPFAVSMLQTRTMKLLIQGRMLLHKGKAQHTGARVSAGAMTKAAPSDWIGGKAQGEQGAAGILSAAQALMVWR